MIRVITSRVDPPAAPTTLVDVAKAAARQEAVDFSEARERLLVSCVQEIEKYCGRAFYRGDMGGARTSVVELEVIEPGRPFHACADLPDTTGVNLSITSVKRWDDDAGLVDATFKSRPGGRIVVPVAGDYEVTCSLLPAGDPPEEAEEGIARLWAAREVSRPGDRGGEGGFDPGASLSNAVVRSGASEIVRHLRRLSA